MKTKNLIFAFFISSSILIPQLVLGQSSFFTELKKPRGKVRSYNEHIYELASGQPVLIEKSLLEYNDTGHLLRKISYNTIDSNAVEYETTFTYEENLLSEELCENRFKITYLYDELGNKIAKKYRSVDEQYLERFMYDETNKLTRKHKYDEGGVLKFSEVYSYDNKKRLIGSKRTFTDTIANNSSASYSLDAQGSMVQERVYAANGHILYSRAFDYDDRQNKIEERRYSASGNLQQRSKYKYQYDATGNWTSIQYISKSASYLITRALNY
ncbi:MAG: hypothetical protein EOO85_16710 [Pedobacter sp.]|nr:MAG: hypothetical protein EOO85_16710 [Pedobacter sp.]